MGDTVDRQEILKLIRQSPEFIDDFVLREAHFGKMLVRDGREKEPAMRAEFEDNMERNHFNVCSRGRGNYSVRFYQTLCAGRIPVLVNSDMVFPFENQIDWDDVVVQGKTAEEALDTLRRWSTERDLVAQQDRGREIWQRYLSVEGFHETLMHELGQTPLAV